MDISGGTDSEVTRLEGVRYLQGALGHAVGSILFLLLGGLLWVVEARILTFVSVVGAFLLSANGLSIWAWDRLRTHFATRTGPLEESGPTRELTVSPLSSESRVEMKAGVVMSLAFVGLLVLGRFALQFLGSRTLGYLCVGILSAGNIIVLAKALYGPSA